MKDLKIGDKAPDFNLASDQGGVISLASFLGKKIVLYFYPKDNTPGCTLESCGFNEALDQFSALGAQIVGVSKDSVESHAKFRQRYHLRFPLLSDKDGEMCRLYGVLAEKSMFGKKYFGIERSTFLMDEAGIIREIWRKVSVAGHVKQVLQAIKNADDT